MKMRPSVSKLVLNALLPLALAAGPALAEKKYGPGVTDTEIKIGQTMAYSGPVSFYSTVGKIDAAYFDKINSEGGINGRKITLISLDDGYNPAKTVEQTRKLVEQEEVLLLFSSLGTPTNSAIHRYVNAKQVPHLFVGSSASKWSDPQNFPWTMGWAPSFHTEARIYAKYLLKTRPNARIGVLYQNDDYGKDCIKGLKDGLADKASMIVRDVTYEATDPSVDSQVVELQASGADTFFIFASARFAAQAIRKSYDIGWRPLTFVNSPAASVSGVLEPAGLEKSVGIISANFVKDPTDPQWAADKGFQDWQAFMKKWYPSGDLRDVLSVWAYSVSQTLMQVLRQCGDDLTRENVMRQAASLRNLELPMLLPGISINTSPTDFYPIKQMQLQRFDGTRWVRFGELLSD